jgi:hypothetical protein
MNRAGLSDCTIGPVLKGLVDSGLLTREVARFEDILKVFCEPAGLGLRLFEVLDDVAIPKGRTSPEPRAGVAVTSTSGADVGRDAGIRGKCARQPDAPALRCAAKEYRPWKGTREKRDRISKKGRVRLSGLV